MHSVALHLKPLKVEENIVDFSLGNSSLGQHPFAVSPVWRKENHATRYCRDQLGLRNAEGSLSPFSVRHLTLGDDKLTLKKIIADCQRNRQDLMSRNNTREREASITMTDGQSPGSMSSMRTSSTNQDPLGRSSMFDVRPRRSIQVGNSGGNLMSPHSIGNPLSDDDVVHTIRSSKNALQSHRQGSSEGAKSTRRDSFRKTARSDSVLMLEHSLRHLPSLKRTLRNGWCVTPFFHLSTGDHAQQIAKLIEVNCKKVDELQSVNTNVVPDTFNFRPIIAGLMKLLRPLWPIGAKKYVSGNVVKPTYRLHLRALWKYAMGRVLVQSMKEKIALSKEAKKKMGELARSRVVEQERVRGKKIAEKAMLFFNDILIKQSSKIRAAPLTEDVYRVHRLQFQELCEGRSELTLSRFVGDARIDPNLIRKIDRDHSGKLDLFEVMKSMYPFMLAKDLQALMRKWDTIDAESSKARESTAAEVLSEDSKAMIRTMFRRCDASNRGVISFADMEAMFVPHDWDKADTLWFERYFPTPTTLVSQDAFMEMIKFCFPPFKHGGYYQQESREPYKKWGWPKEVLEAQDRAGIID